MEKSQRGGDVATKKITAEKKATMVSSLVAAMLVLTKAFVGVLSGSVAVLASAIDSALDLAVSAFNYFAISRSEKPASERFNYGFGKIEGLAATIEGTIIIMSGLFILYKAIAKAILGGGTTHLEISMGVMLFSLVTTALLVIYLNRTAKATNNLVVKADAMHYKTDLFANVGVLFSLLLVKLLGNHLIDAFVGAVIAIYIIYSAYEILREGILNLLDVALDEKLVEQIKAVIQAEPDVSSYHFLRTRKAGNNCFVEAHLVFQRGILLDTAHDAADHIESEIAGLDDRTQWVFNLHLDPVDDSGHDHEVED
jgi:cation diffusion facilitator family transporter